MAKKSLSTKELKELIELRRQADLPHLFAWKWYQWAYDYFHSTNKHNFLCAANQISKSTTQIRKSIDWATDQNKWPKLWPHIRPSQFWYLYPSSDVATTEFHEKWVPEVLPRGKMKDDPIYGWEADFDKKKIQHIRFNSGITIYFKTYAQDVQNLQTGTVSAVFCDEELPYHLYQELRSRLAATNGYFNMVFTATLGQDEWRRTMEPVNEGEELFKNAFKIQISMYDCLKYTDGSNSHWTPDRIRQIELECATEAEVLRRVHGRFVLSSGQMFPSFERKFNIVPKQVIPSSWSIYSGVDIGTGGDKNHPAAIVFVAVRPDHKFGIIFRGWRGDGIVTTTADILEKHNDMLKYEAVLPNGTLITRAFHPVLQSYDWQSKDFFTIASRAGIAFTPADKKRDTGANLLNTLFKLRMLAVMDDDPELAKLVIEIVSLKVGTPKSKAKDDFIDATRYAVMPIPWDFDGVAGELIKEETIDADTRTEAQKDFDERRSTKNPYEEEGETIEDVFSEWQGYLDG